jgi:HTH-type transcriptional regulator / antitoxin HigA
VKVKAIKTDQDHGKALHRIEALWNAKSKDEKEELAVLATLVEAYERVHHPIDPPDPIEALKVRMSQKGYSRKDLVDLLGSRSRATEILNRTRALTIEMIRKLNSQWEIPAEILIRKTRIKRSSKPSTRRMARRIVDDSKHR